MQNATSNAWSNFDFQSMKKYTICFWLERDGKPGWGFGSLGNAKDSLTCTYE